MIRLGLLGGRGKMGQIVSKLASAEFASKVKLEASPARGEKLLGLLNCDVVIDFSSSGMTCEFVEAAKSHSGKLPALVVGSTGWSLDQRHHLEELAAKTPVLVSSNFSTGVLALLDVLKTAGPLFKKLGYNPVLVERHHEHKKDAPSGTAISMQRAVSPMGPGNVPTHSIRAGEIIGDHEITFYGSGDHVTFAHYAQDRSIFARGAIECGLWLETQRGAPTGKLMSMDSYFAALTK